MVARPGEPGQRLTESEFVDWATRATAERVSAALQTGGLVNHPFRTAVQTAYDLLRGEIYGGAEFPDAPEAG